MNADNNRIMDLETDLLTEELLRKLQLSPLSDDQIERFCLKEANLLLSPQKKEQLEENMLDGFLDYFKSFGRSASSLGETLGQWQERAEELRQTINWDDVPPDLRETCRHRAELIIEFGLNQDWIKRTTEKTWQITDKGKEFLANGGYYIR